MLPPTSSVPPSGDSMGMYRRKVHTGTIDAQGSLLVHPMTWLDERLFGWSRSARRGTSAWAGNASISSLSTSRVASPDVSDDEDHGDYDNVIGYLPSIVGDAISGLGFARSRTPNRSRVSLRGSYADLPSVRRAEEDRAKMTGESRSRKSQPSSPLLSVRQLPPSPTSSVRFGGPRQRKMSLTDNVPVERIGQLQKDESFTEATEELNKENEEKRRKRE
jgi:glycerol-3-phosphate O-acyltransferase / dihydroxyacetone phosphate acyltransferase